ncbi:MAG: TetR/AcrR family transcriptional regulator [Nocardioides sp.]
MPARRSPVPLTVERIQMMSRDLIARHGVAGLSMRGLARALDVDPMAIYHHVPNKAALLAQVREGVIAELFMGEAVEVDWQSRLKDLLRRFRALAIENPNIFPDLIASSTTSPGMNRAVDAVLGTLLQAGFRSTRAVRMGDVVFSFVTGFVLLELNSQDDAESPPPDALVALPHVRALHEDLVANEFADSFESALDFVVAGLERQLAEEGEEAAPGR